MKQFLRRLFCFHKWDKFQMKQFLGTEMEQWRNCQKCDSFDKWDKKKKKWDKIQ